MKYSIIELMRLFAATLSFFYISFAQAEAPKVCVVSFLESHLNDEVVESTTEILTRMGYTNAKSRFEFFGYPASLQGPGDAYSSLRNCIEGNYEEVIIISHNFTSISDDSNMVYIEDENTGAMGFINDRFFRNIEFSNSLRQITLLACKAEAVYETYKNLVTQAQEKKINLKVAPTSLYVDMLDETFGVGEGFRKPREAGFLIAEAAQDLHSQTTFCYIYSEVQLGDGRTGTSCLRNHFFVEDKPYQKAERPNDTDWLILSWQADPASSSYVNTAYANPGDHPMVRQFKELGESPIYGLRQDSQGVFRYPNPGPIGLETQIRIYER